ncbi:MAG: hypothetical protein PUC29_08145 [Clostridia bacterium]|nr:hypothetical protein [Clostridia bacterium]
MALTVISAVVFSAVLFVFNISAFRKICVGKAAKSAFFVNLGVFLCGAFAGALSFFLCPIDSAVSPFGDFSVFCAVTLSFAAAATLFCIICALLSPKTFALRLSFSFAWAVLLQIYSYICATLTRAEDFTAFVYVLVFGICCSFWVQLSPALDFLRFSVSEKSRRAIIGRQEKRRKAAEMRRKLREKRKSLKK